MTRFRKLMLVLLAATILSSLGQALMHMAFDIFGATDDWLFRPASVPAPLIWIPALWFGVEFFRLLILGGWALNFGILMFTIALLASVAGPMIGSITDQGRIASDMGYSVGGAKDVGNFRTNIENGYLPLPTDLTFEGLFYDYGFDTGKTTRQASEEPVPGNGRLFFPTYRCAVSRHPLTGETETYLSIGLNSDMKQADFQRKKLNLVIVLDISGSMGASFDEYYYDRARNGISNESEGQNDFTSTKLEIACQSITAMLKHLKPDDRFGMVIYDDSAVQAKPLRLIRETNMAAISRHILELMPGGATNMEDGLTMGCEMLKGLAAADRSEYENRVVFLTDAQPNVDDTSESGLLGITRANSRLGTYLTFIGIGVDFNTQLTESITKIRGANYYSIHSSREFARRLDDEFELMVTPLVFDLVLSLESKECAIERVYGSPEADEATGEIMRVRTLFPSKTTDEGTRGGIVLLKLRRTEGEPGMLLRISFENRSGMTESNVQQVEIPESALSGSGFFDNDGIRKGVLLARYGDLIHDWILNERGIGHDARYREKRRLGLNSWERTSEPLRVSKAAGDAFREFERYFVSEAKVIGDPALNREIDILKRLTGLTYQ
ncbi:MAG TPA: VWA domain-containing protein [Candidatus Ozemobacteraceae bacterium]|nr:VWA domain-containing protein [Candidatus Ozemobacteraceae bacterium]